MGLEDCTQGLDPRKDQKNGVLQLWITQTDSWHAIYVLTGQEEKVKNALDKHFAEQLKSIIPKRELRERKGGKWHQVQRKLFPGYVLVKGTITSELYYQIKNLPMLTNLLKSEEGPLSIEEHELEVLNILFSDEEGTIGFSTAYKEHDQVQVLSGPLVGLEGYIQSVDKRKGRARVKIEFLGQVRTVELGIHVLDKI